MELANKARPKRFDEVTGQESEIAVVKKFIEKGFKPNAVMITGPFGTGKTTTARLIARAMLCEQTPVLGPDGTRTNIEPCGKCLSCRSVDSDSNPNYVEVDAASQGLIGDIRAMKDEVSYASGDKLKIVCYDESHMLSTQAQNALLQILEEGAPGVMFVFCTTEANRMLPTIKSRCIILRMRLLTAGQISKRLTEVAASEGIKIEPRTLNLIGTYVRGHVRDSLVLLGQLHLMTTGQEDRTITEAMVRTYLRLDQQDDIYALLVETDRKSFLEKLEGLLCNYSAGELQEIIGEVLLAAFKTTLGIDPETQVDKAWLTKVASTRDTQLMLDHAEAVFKINTSFSTIGAATTAFAQILLPGIEAKAAAPARSLRPGGEPTTPLPTNTPFRKPGK